MLFKQRVANFLSLFDKALYHVFQIVTAVDRNLIVFEGTFGQFDESCWVLYKYLQKCQKYRFVWIVKHPRRFVNTPDTLFISRYNHFLNPYADFYYSKAGYSFFTHTTSPVKYKRKGQTRVFIGHGYAIKGHKGSTNFYENFDYALAIGKAAIHTQSLFIGCKENQLLPLGLPRNDLLIRESKSGRENPFIEGRNFDKVVIWMPTFRESKGEFSERDCATETGLPLFDTEEKVERLNSYLSSCNCAVLLKIHRLQLSKETFGKKYSNLIIIKDTDIEDTNAQLYQVIGKSDALLTDYSSVSLDYLLLDKPIGYILNDMASYQKDRGFTSEDPTTVMAGDFLYTEDDVYAFFKKIVVGDDDKRTERATLCRRIHAAPNGNSCELVCSFFNL